MTTPLNSDNVPSDYAESLPFQRAAALYEAARFEEASAVLVQLLETDPDDLDVRHALAMCQVKLNQIGEAISNFRRIVERDSTRYDDARRLGVLLEQEGAYRQAAEAFRMVLAVTDYLDTADRLRECETMIKAVGSLTAPRDADTAVMPAASTGLAHSQPITGDLITPGPAPIRKVIDELNVTDRGRHIQDRDVTQQTRHLLPTLTRAGTEAIAVTLLPPTISIIVSLLPTDWQSQLTKLSPAVHTVLSWAVPLIIILIWLRVVVKSIALIVQSRLYQIKVYERGMDIATGVFRRRKRYLWYYQITEEPAYVRTPIMFLTHTASLRIKYNDSAATTQDIELAGIGSPREVEELRNYIENRRLAERATMRGFLT